MCHILSWATYLFWTGIFAIYYFSGDFIDFLNPQLGWLVFLAFLLNLVFFLAVFFASPGRADNHQHHHTRHRAVKMLIVLAPVIYLAGFESTQLGGYAFNKRAVNLAGVNTNAVSMARNMKVDGDFNYHDLLVASAAARLPAQVSLLDLHADFEKLLGKRIITRGIYVDSSEGIPGGHFIIFRFIMVCCVADAQPLAVLIAGEKPAGAMKDAWLEIEGTVNSISIENNPAIVILADKIRTSTAPENPYLTPRMQ